MKRKKVLKEVAESIPILHQVLFRDILKVLRFLCLKWLKSRPKSSRDCLMCAKFAGADESA